MRKYIRRAVLAFSVRNRKKKAQLVLAFMAEAGLKTAIFVGCSPGRNRNERIVENAVSEKIDVLATCDVLLAPDSARFVVGDGRALPFRSGATSLIVANAVIEHVGGELEQRRFVSEQSRVGQAWVITTPNRWFPVESHTSVIMRHWSAKWRARRPEFTRLLSRGEFAELLPSGAVVHGRPWSPTFTAIYNGSLSPTGSRLP